LEKIERLLLVFNQWIALPISAQSNSFFQMVEVEEMVLPLLIDDLQQEVLLVEPHDLMADGGLLLLVAAIHGRRDALDDLVALHRIDVDVRRGKVEAEVVEQLDVELRPVDRLMRILGDMRIDEELDDLIGGVEDVLLP